MALKAIFWDNDGVLVDTEAPYLQACADTLGRFGIELTREAFVEISLRRGESVLELARDRADEGHLRKLRNERYQNLLSSRDLVLLGVREVLGSLHGRPWSPAPSDPISTAYTAAAVCSPISISC